MKGSLQKSLEHAQSMSYLGSRYSERKRKKDISDNDLKISSIALLLDSFLILYLSDRYFLFLVLLVQVG